MHLLRLRCTHSKIHPSIVSLAQRVAVDYRTCRFSSSTSISLSNDIKYESDSSQDQDEEKGLGYLMKEYHSMVQKGTISYDIHQVGALEELDRLRRELMLGENQKLVNLGDEEEREVFSPWKPASRFLSNIFSNLTDSYLDESSSLSSLLPLSQKQQPKGVYLHGGVGCGKTFCMDLFFDSLSTHQITSKQKVHFHKFMLHVHQQMHHAKMVQKIRGDPLPNVIENVISKGKIICFDEFQVTDIADALILRRLFTGLLNKGAILVATSNRPPADLYLNGIQRDLFLPFIHFIEQRLNVVSMWESTTDYRLVYGQNKAKSVYFTGPSSKPDFQKAFRNLTQGGSKIQHTNLFTQGRTIHIPKASITHCIAKFTFHQLCHKPMGAADYLAIGQHFHTVFLQDVPKLNRNEVNAVRRFIIFVDAMYECKVKLIVHAEAAPENLFEIDLKNDVCDEVFAFDRTKSRLEEMGSEDYLKKRWVGKKSKAISNVYEPNDVMLVEI